MLAVSRVLSAFTAVTSRSAGRLTGVPADRPGPVTCAVGFPGGPVPNLVRTYCQFGADRYSLSNKGGGWTSVHRRVHAVPAQRVTTSALPWPRPVPPPHSGMAWPPVRSPGELVRPAPVPVLVTDRSWRRSAVNAPVRPCLRFVNVLQCRPGLKNTRAYVTHRKNCGAAAIAAGVVIYPIRDLYTTPAAAGKGRICGFTSGLRLGDLSDPGRASRAAPRYGVSVLFQCDKEYCRHYGQAGRGGLIAGPGRRPWAGIARCMCIRKC